MNREARPEARRWHGARGGTVWHGAKGWVMTEPLFIAVDVHYLDEEVARAAAVAACEPAFSRVAWSRAVVVPAGGAVRAGRVLPA